MPIPFKPEPFFEMSIEEAKKLEKILRVEATLDGRHSLELPEEIERCKCSDPVYDVIQESMENGWQTLLSEVRIIDALYSE